LRLAILTLTAVAGAGCARTELRVGRPAPNPNGCYVMVYDQPGFRGVGDLWNGPGRWATLDGLRQTNQEGWRNRIRSLRVGSAATVTVYTDANFKGESRQFAHPHLDPTFSGRIESVQLACR
jgi:hypothetical protein